MGDMQVGVTSFDDKGVMENKPVNAAASSNPSLQVSVSFGRFENDSLSWEKFSAFSPNKYLEEVGKCATPGSVAQKKAYFEAHYKKIAERKAEIMDQEKLIHNNASFRSIITDHGRLVTESVVDEGSNGKFTCEEDKHMTDIDVLDKETIILNEPQSSLDQVKEVVKDSLDNPNLEKPEDIVLVEERSEVIVDIQEKPVEVLQVDEEEDTEVSEGVREEVPSKDDSANTTKEVKKEKKHNIKKNDRNVQVNPTRASLKPNQVTTNPTSKKIVTSRQTPQSKEVRSMTKATKKPEASISKPPPRVYKAASQITSLSTSHSSLKKEKASALLRNKQTAPKSLHISLSLGPSASDPSASDQIALTSTRRSLIMDRMGDKDIVKRAFKTFQKSLDFKTSVNDQNTAPKQNPAKATSMPSLATRQKENGRPTKSSSMGKISSGNTHHSSSHGMKSNETSEKQQKEFSRSGARPVENRRVQKNPKAGVIDAKTRRDSLNQKAKPMLGSLPVRTIPKGSLDKIL